MPAAAAAAAHCFTLDPAALDPATVDPAAAPTLNGDVSLPQIDPNLIGNLPGLVRLTRNEHNGTSFDTLRPSFGRGTPCAHRYEPDAAF